MQLSLSLFRNSITYYSGWRYSSQEEGLPNDSEKSRTSSLYYSFIICKRELGKEILQDQVSGEYALYRPKNIPEIAMDKELLQSIS